jgi:hypothetical protein
MYGTGRPDLANFPLLDACFLWQFFNLQKKLEFWGHFFATEKSDVFV